MTKDGIEIVTATDRGEGRMTRSATATYPGTLFFNVLSGAKPAFPNHIIGFNEYEVDELGGYLFKLWERK
jgi:hypothetical protein